MWDPGRGNSPAFSFVQGDRELQSFSSSDCPCFTIAEVVGGSSARQLKKSSERDARKLDLFQQPSADQCRKWVSSSALKRVSNYLTRSHSYSHSTPVKCAEDRGGVTAA